MGIVNLLKIMRNESEKVVILNLRVRPDVRDAFRIAADLRGASMSGLIHQFIVKTIREEKDREPEAFRDIVIIPPVSNIQDQTGLHRNPSNVGKKKADKQAESIIINQSASF